MAVCKAYLLGGRTAWRFINVVLPRRHWLSGSFNILSRPAASMFQGCRLWWVPDCLIPCCSTPCLTW
jgi:hypothetical protein